MEEASGGQSQLHHAIQVVPVGEAEQVWVEVGQVLHDPYP
jgi:hypothetical protein